MKESTHYYYSALAARDPRFDGVFFVGVTSTGIYCRPVCPAKTPKAASCRFFATAEAAERDSFRPCLRCRPELAPGNAPVDDARRIAHLLATRIEEGIIDSSASLADIARHFELSPRQVRRIVRTEIGVPPIVMMQSRRLLLAKQLLTETALPVTEIAFASGFSSLRRFNDAFRTRYRMAPGRLRRQTAIGNTSPIGSDTSAVQLVYRPPYDWDGMLAFLEARATPGVEWVSDDAYHRTVRLGAHRGWISVRHAPAKRALVVQFTHTLTPALPALLGRLRNLFDLSARPDVISAHFAKDRRLARHVRMNPGLRVPGAFDGFEIAVRAVAGQQVTVKAATTLCGRLAAAFGEEIATPFPQLNTLAPIAAAIGKASASSITELGFTGVRARALVTLAKALCDGRLCLDAGSPPDAAVTGLRTLDGVGPWTAQYVVMRAVRWPDAFPKEDIIIRRRLGGVSAAQAEEISRAWRPWRSYAVLHLWQSEL